MRIYIRNGEEGESPIRITRKGIAAIATYVSNTKQEGRFTASGRYVWPKDVYGASRQMTRKVIFW